MLATLAAAGLWFLGRPALARRHDVAARRALYGAFPEFPGSTRIGERSYEIRGDGVGTGDYGLTVTYRLPSATEPATVVAFFRDALPPGWREVTDQTCEHLRSRLAPPPPPAPGSPATSAPPAKLALIRAGDEFTAFAPDSDTDGVTVGVRAFGRDTVLTLDQVHFGCQPA
ncbi:MAG: hypothetical protein ACRDY5_08000 [Acidimicrobiales bacterium]